jgi:hypothetical protein
MFITRKHLHRRDMLRGLGITVGLPLLDAMVPALTALANTPAAPVKRFACAYMGNGAQMAQWTPATEGALVLSPTLAPLEPVKNQVFVMSGLDQLAAESRNDGAGAHPRSQSAFLTGAHVNAGESHLEAGTSLDQMVADAIGRDTPLRSLELSIDENIQVGNCAPRYPCVYINTISWRKPTMPLPMETNPRVVFENLFGDGDTAAQRIARAREDRSILDFVSGQVTTLRGKLGPSDKRTLGEYLDTLREVEQRIQTIDRQNASLPVPERPSASHGAFLEYATLMFDLQALAFQGDLTRVTTMVMTRENSGRPYPEIGVADGHHSVSHHGNRPDRMAAFAKINGYHVNAFAEFVKKLAGLREGDGTILDHSIVLFGSGMSDGNTHDILDLPLLLAEVVPDRSRADATSAMRRARRCRICWSVWREC